MKNTKQNERQVVFTVEGCTDTFQIKVATLLKNESIEATVERIIEKLKAKKPVLLDAGWELSFVK